MTEKAQVVIIGGGIVGSYTAFVLARRGVKTLLIERDAIGAHASGANPGGLNPLHGAGIPGPMSAFSLKSFALHGKLRREIERLAGCEAEFKRRERVIVAMNEQELNGLRGAMELHNATPGFGARMVDGSELRAPEPRISREAIGGLVTSGHASVEAKQYTIAVAEAARKSGALIQMAAVTGIEARNGRVTAVVTSLGGEGGAIECEHVVIATGAWVAEPAKWLGVNIPVRPVKGDLISARVGDGRRFERDFVWGDAAVYGTDGAEITLGGTEEDAGLDEKPSASARERILQGVAKLMPGVGPLQVERQTAGLRPTTPDHLPIVGPAPGWSNVLLALGGGRKGMLYSAGMAQAMAELVIDGATSIDLDVCRPDRFSSMSQEISRTPAVA